MPQTLYYVLRHKNALGRLKIRILTFIGLIPDLIILIISFAGASNYYYGAGASAAAAPTAPPAQKEKKKKEKRFSPMGFRPPKNKPESR